MKPGIKILKETEGTGAEAARGKTLIINMRMFLPNGSELAEVNRYGQRRRINLARRDEIAGVRYGLEGMRVGGHRLFSIRPHLAYGEAGIPGQIPPNSEIHCEVDLLEVRDDNALRPEDYEPGRKVFAHRSGDIPRGLSSWQFGLEEDGRCGITVTKPIPGLKWRHVRPKYVESKIDQSRALALFDFVIQFPSQFPNECLLDTHGEGGDSGRYINDKKEILSVGISVSERGKDICKFDVADNSQAWLTSDLFKTIDELNKLIQSGLGKQLGE
jgi:hypothetical protein